MFTIDNFKILEELRKTLGSITGVKQVQERVGLEYMVVAEDNSTKEGAERVSEELMRQASKFNFDLEVIVTTEQEMKDVQDKMMKELTKNSSFKS